MMRVVPTSDSHAIDRRSFLGNIADTIRMMNAKRQSSSSGMIRRLSCRNLDASNGVTACSPHAGVMFVRRELGVSCRCCVYLLDQMRHRLFQDLEERLRIETDPEAERDERRQIEDLAR